jgi:hypothetical protein
VSAIVRMVSRVRKGSAAVDAGEIMPQYQQLIRLGI